MDLVILANAWGAGLDNPTSKHQVALELARQGHRVLWVEGAGMRKPSLGSGPDRGRIVRKVMKSLRGARCVQGERIWVLTPLLIPMPSNAVIRQVNSWIYFLSSRLWCVLLGFKKPVLINYVPVLSHIERLWSRRISRKDAKTQRNARVVYHCVDRWDSFDMYDKDMMRRVDEECCRYADVVVASASDLYERCKTYNENAHLVRHGVNYEHFAKATEIRHRAEEKEPQMDADERGLLLRSEGRKPKDLPEGQIIGFFGLLSEWVDQELLLSLARALRETKAETGNLKAERGEEGDVGNATSAFSFQLSALPQIVLIGSADVDVSRLQAEPNIHLLGPKPFAELPGYVAWFDVGIIPFVVNELTSAVNPIKLREMIAAGCPVVSTAMREVEVCVKQMDENTSGSQPPAVIGRSHTEFMSEVVNVLSNPPSVDVRRRISASVADETWSAKVGEILRHVREMEPQMNADER